MSLTQTEVPPAATLPRALGETPAPARPDRVDRGTRLTICPRRMARILSGLVLLLAVTGTIANYVIYNVAPHPEDKLARLMRRFDLGHEPSLPGWYSSIALLACSALLAVIARHALRARSRDVAAWAGLAVVFLLLAMDEALMFHEMLSNTLQAWLNSSGVLYFAWVLPGATFVLLVAALCARFLVRLERRTRLLFIISGVVFVSGAIGMELAAGVVVESWGVESLAHTAIQTCEESLEMFGVVMFLYALLDWMGRNIGPFQIHVEASSATPDQ